MKQVTYEFDWRNVMFCLMRDRDDVDDGYWQLTAGTEVASPVMLQAVYPGQQEGVLPAVITRLTGLRMVKVSNPGPLTIEIRDGLVKVEDGTDTDQRGHEEGGGGPGGDPGPIAAGF